VIKIGSNGSETSVLDPRHLFHRHQLDASFRIRARIVKDQKELNVTFRAADSAASPPLSAKLELNWVPGITKTIDLDASKGTTLVSMYSGATPWEITENHRCLFVPSSGLSQLQVIHELDAVLLTNDEPLVLSALRILDPTIERIAVSLDSVSLEGRFGGVVVNCQGQPPKLPIGILGEGMWRLLGLALGLTYCRNGVLLIDDVDSGLHYSVMEKMWQIVDKTARELNVQVFATTHSRDCVDALASIARTSVFEGSDVMIHRIESGKSKSIAYSEAEITAVAEFGNEVR
jgi:hypothetical protein